ncbi:MAG: hypothetical protein IJ246_09030 [Clostridia bacterium]|nr:hypothetical protein [Clostridia bacterium]
MRKTEDEKAKIVARIPNHELLDVEESGVTWSRVTYKGQTGYLKTEYLLLPSALPGQTVYPDTDGVYVYTAPDTDSSVCGMLSCLDPVLVDEAGEEWLLIRSASLTGYVSVKDFSWQSAVARDKPSFIPLDGILQQQAVLRLPSGNTLEMAPGTRLRLYSISGDTCLASINSLLGELPCTCIAITIPDDAIGKAPENVTAKATQALKKQYKAFAKTTFFPLYLAYGDNSGMVLYLNEDDQVLYGTMVQADTGKVLLAQSYSSFALPVEEKDFLPYGEVRLTLSAKEMQAGDVLTMDVQAWTDANCRWSVVWNGKDVFPPRDSSHFSAAFRPRQGGEYTVSITVTDEQGYAVSQAQNFTVTEAALSQPLVPVYSQKDGWWEDKTYRKSDLEQSGCAIFTLSHALYRMGWDSDDILPENLARTYALCLTVDGTNNARLITEAASDYGFTTRKTLYTDPDEIRSLLLQGAMFSFSIARGHIALVEGPTEDPTLVRIVDSAPSATYERITGSSLYYEKQTGVYRIARTLDAIPGALWYPETDMYGGLTYALPLTYVAKRGARLIQLENDTIP